MLFIVADCVVSYEGRLSTTLPLGRRAILIKDNGSVQIHADHRPIHGFKPLNWMGGGPHTVISYGDNSIEVSNHEERLVVDIYKWHVRVEQDLGEEPGLRAIGTEKQYQAILADDPGLLEEGLVLVRREYPTTVGPVDLLCRSEHGYIAVEIKRARASIHHVDQVLRYLEVLSEEPQYQPCTAMLAAVYFPPQTLVYAERHGVICREFDPGIITRIQSIQQPALFS